MKLLDWIVKRRALALITVGLLSLLANSLVGVVTGIPEPSSHDEFSYLLAADTFSEGRITNPPHAMWRFFETFHVLQLPTYMSIYPPAQGLVLAFGKVVFGHPIWGVWLSVALMCAGICWMLYAWLPPRWAFVGGLAAVTSISFTSYWARSYWGGAPAALGGALIFGAMRRIIKKVHARDACLLGVGLAILANSRPYEGFIASIPAFFILLKTFVFEQRLSGIRLFKHLVLPLLLILIPTFAAMLIYNAKVTGNPFRSPVFLAAEKATAIPFFLWQPLKQVVPSLHAPINRFEKFFNQQIYFQKRTPLGFLYANFFSLLMVIILSYWVMPLLIPLVLFFNSLRRDRWVRFSGLTILLVLGSVSLLSFNWSAHYVAPVACLAFFLIACGLRMLFLNPRVSFMGRRVIPVLFIASIFLQCGYALSIVLQRDAPWSLKRHEIIEVLNKVGGSHLIIVRYEPGHNFHQEWVYNEADIDRAKIVWARDLGHSESMKLVEYFKDRRIWLLDADGKDRRLVPFSLAEVT